MKKVRIVKETGVDGRIQYVIQQKHWLFRWAWVGVSINSMDYVYCDDHFDTLEDAKENYKIYKEIKWIMVCMIMNRQ